MCQEEIVNRMNTVNEVIFEITKRDILSAIVRRLGVKALTLSEDDLRLAVEEVKIAIDHNLDVREFIDEGLDAWDIVRDL